MPPTRIWQVITMLFMITTALSKPQMASAALPDDKLLHLGAGVALGAAGYGLAACLHEKSWVRASSGIALGSGSGSMSAVTLRAPLLGLDPLAADARCVFRLLAHDLCCLHLLLKLTTHSPARSLLLCCCFPLLAH